MPEADNEAMTRMFYDLHDDVHIPHRWHLDDPITDEGCEPWELRSGRALQVRSIPVVEVDTPGVALDFTLTHLAVPIVSPRLLRAIKGLLGADVQRIPVRVGARDGYEILNVLRVIPCLDEGRSEFVRWTEKDNRPDRLGGYKSVPRIRVDAAAVPPDVNFFRLGGWSIALLVSQAVVDAYLSINATGAVFRPVLDPDAAQ